MRFFHCLLFYKQFRFSFVLTENVVIKTSKYKGQKDQHPWAILSLPDSGLMVKFKFLFLLKINNK